MVRVLIIVATLRSISLSTTEWTTNYSTATAPIMFYRWRNGSPSPSCTRATTNGCTIERIERTSPYTSKRRAISTSSPKSSLSSSWFSSSSSSSACYSIRRGLDLGLDHRRIYFVDHPVNFSFRFLTPCPLPLLKKTKSNQRWPEIGKNSEIGGRDDIRIHLSQNFRCVHCSFKKK